MASFDLGRVICSGDEFERQMGGGQRDAEPAAAVVLAEQHHGGAFGAGELGEELGLPDEARAGAA